MTAKHVDNLIGVFVNLTPPERVFLITHDLELFRDLHQLNRLLTEKIAPPDEINDRLPYDLDFLKVDPREQISKQYEPIAHQSMFLFATLKNTHFFAHMLK